ncbi:type VII secretion protein EccCa [Nocardioides sp.]|uniref:type VII secretion protein EccCa n=1 Tax=Nocardioides sp. TaxID=35761 RepID=UPI0025F741C3|nr:type VII secretion protein EccCa [Nocardioides sp.]
MTTMLRAAPLDDPEIPAGTVVLDPPPQLHPREGGSGVLMNALPLLGSLGSIALVATMGRASGGRALIAAGLFLLSTLGFVLVQVDRQRRQRQVAGPRTAYLRYLADVRRVVRDAAARQRAALTWRHPHPANLAALACERSRVWERGESHPLFLRVRYGVGAQPLALDLVAPSVPTGHETDVVATRAVQRLVAVHRSQRDLPVAVDLRGAGRIEVCGPEEAARALARSVVCSAATFHSPDDLRVAVLASPAHLPHWDWVKWLPHAHSDRRRDAIGPLRTVATAASDLGALLPVEPADGEVGPHVLLVVDGVEPPEELVVRRDGSPRITVVDLPSRWHELDDPARVRVRLVDARADAPAPGGDDRRRDRGWAAVVVHGRGEPLPVLGDQLTVADAEALARRLAPLRLQGSEVRAGLEEARRPRDYLTLLQDPFDPETGWRPRAERDRLRVPIGLGEDGAVVHLDLKESAQAGMGPHGLVIGATGSGKSELLRTLVLGLALTHSPEQLNLVLVDFKGGATFAGMSGLPHVSAIITNLAQELPLVDRMQDALAGELVRRQELLRSAGNVSSIHEYERARASGADLAPMPSLFVVVDEFSELLAAKPEFIDLFVAIGRLGRSLGLHLLLASQRLEEGRLRGLESHLSYRLGLRTFSAAESRAALGVPDAYELPADPGVGLLRPDPTTTVRFKASYVSGPRRTSAALQQDEPRQGILPFTLTEVADPAVGPPEQPPAVEPVTRRESLLELSVRRMSGRGPRAHQVWLPPLDEPDTLADLMSDLTARPPTGLVSPSWRARDGLVVPVGTVDRPREQRRETLTVDLTGSAGHAVVVGGPRSGKSTLLRTMVASLALATTPQETQFFVLDFGGGTFAPFDGLPHVAGVATRGEPEAVRRVVAEVRGVVDRREAYFHARGLDSMEAYRSRRAAGRCDDGHGDVFLVVDGWSTVRAEFEDLESELQQLAGRGLAFGVHLLVAAARWADVRAATRDLFGTRLELRLGDPLDSEVDRVAAALVPTGRPGRGLVPSRLHFLAALPRIDGRRDAATLGEGVSDLVARVAAAWTGPTAPPLRLLPTTVTLDEVRAVAGPRTSDRQLLVAVREQDLGAVGLDPDAEPHLLVFGDRGAGKSGLLRSYCREVIRTRSPREAQLVVVDHRRSLLGEVPGDHLLDYLTSTERATSALTELASYLQARLPGPDVTPAQLRDRSWWSGAEVFVVVDDHDLVATSQASPLQALVPLLAQARDVGLHVVLARRTGGASRALYEPVIQSLRDLAAPGLLLSGSPDEGPLLGSQRPQPAAPGRARLVTRDRGVEVVQVAWSAPRL